MDEAGFIEAIRRDLHDDTPRLVYADWLDERGDPRGEYLRVQCELKQTWAYANPCRELFARAAELRARIDPGWLVLAHRCTTPAPPVAVARAVPELRRLAKKTVCLHPRPGAAPADASKIGGPVLWPAGEDWPACPEHDCPLVAALQLRKQHVPEVRFPRAKDLLQVLWCPNDHDLAIPAARVYWRRAAAVKDPAGSFPAPPRAEDRYLPRPCVLYPERVVEYPDPFELDDDLRDWIGTSEELAGALEQVSGLQTGGWDLPEDAAHLYQTWLSTADGTKVGGYPDWVQGPEYPDCACGATMELLVMFSSWEFDGVTWGRWLPVEERDALKDRSIRRREEVGSPAGWMFGDAGNMYLFMCRSCKERPIECRMQCS